MMSQPGVMAPRDFKIRDVKSPEMKNGLVANPPRFQTLGGMTGQGKWPTGSDFPVEKPTTRSAGKRAYEKKASS